LDTGLDEKHVLITGASGGIGLVVARLFLTEGAKVTGTYNQSADTLHDLKSEWPDSLEIVKVDQSSESEVRDLFDKANSSFGRVDVLVANAGIATHEGKSIQNMTTLYVKEDQTSQVLESALARSHYQAKFHKLDLENPMLTHHAKP